ncbi:hypothetical protein FAES_3227 [Fibrella aestuarina BUZ 2]|uniref:Uncharacterized protein n=1 Tax=Fibrella aestuarina BUZ 2 TaxID=1166018 RepID=I0KAT3_9BACT|nr:hypothetical protein [Fibrella aestuarina]CCH01236.1 hypothetical protein FAES_3227 [Fibrella aestuarina BUZ 2]
MRDQGFDIALQVLVAMVHRRIMPVLRPCRDGSGWQLRQCYGHEWRTIVFRADGSVAMMLMNHGTQCFFKEWLPTQVDAGQLIQHWQMGAAQLPLN